MNNPLSSLRAWWTRIRSSKQKEIALPLCGFPPNTTVPGFVNMLSDEELMELNELLPWHCFTTDSHGRRFGRPAGATKRNLPQELPDRRIVMMNQRFDLADKHVLEIGCFEGVHTIALAGYAAHVTAIDSRIGNIVKTMVRCGFHDVHPVVRKCNIEDAAEFSGFHADVVHHVGVLYHLKDPVSHVRALGKQAGIGVMLDTHYCHPEQAACTYIVDGKPFRYQRQGEHGCLDPFSGMYDHAKWLTLECLEALLKEAGFWSVDLAETRDERNGPRALIFARR